MDSEKADLKLELLGATKAPLLIIDNGSSQLDKIKKTAINSDFCVDQANNYPGIRAPIDRETVIAYIKPLLPFLYKVFKIPEQLTPHPIDNYYSLITTDEQDLTPSQTIPHFDTNNRYYIAMIHYLNDGDFGGTGFFKHKATGYEFVDQARRKPFLRSVERYLTDNINKPMQYCNARHPAFELHHSAEYKANRMLIFQGFMLHSTLVNTQRGICSSPQKGRLTANLFIDFH